MNEVHPEKNRKFPRMSRVSRELWQLSIDDNLLITRNIMNISGTGLGFKAPRWFKVQVGQIVRMQILLGLDHVFECEARVVWAGDDIDQRTSMQRIGVEFEEIPQGLTEHLENRELVDLELESQEESPKKVVHSKVAVQLIRLIGILIMLGAVFTAFYYARRSSVRSIQSIEFYEE